MNQALLYQCSTTVSPDMPAVELGAADGFTQPWLPAPSALRFAKRRLPIGVMELIVTTDGIQCAPQSPFFSLPLLAINFDGLLAFMTPSALSSFAVRLAD